MLRQHPFNLHSDSLCILRIWIKAHAKDSPDAAGQEGIMVKRIQQIVTLILAFFIGLFIASSFLFRAKYNYSVYGDRAVLEGQQPLVFLLWIVVVLVLGFVLYRLSRKLEGYSRAKVIPAVLLLSVILQARDYFPFQPYAYR